MDATLATLVPLFRANNDLFRSGLAGVSREDLLRRPHNESNPLIWVAAHALSWRSSLAKMVGADVNNPWAKLFEGGTKLEADMEYPEASEVVALWDDMTRRLMKRFEELSAEELAKAAPFGVPFGENTLRGAIVFLNFHETYHIGQIGFLRKWLGYSQLIG
jgi:crotonobetainyl-CoA:carnitine CoA-transferase CaiB-like acyl-CoA transferase